MDKNMKNENYEQELITVVAVEPGKKPYVQSIPNTLESLQHEVGGDVQAITPYADQVAIIAADEGKLMGLPFNRAVRDEDGTICDHLVGKFLIVGVGEEDFTSIPADLIPKYEREFQTPEQFVRIGEKYCILPAKDTTPVYPHNAEYAAEHNEIQQYRESMKSNIACKEAIEKAVYDNYDCWKLDAKTAMAQVAAQFTPERIKYVLAATVQQKEFDGRISSDNKAWSKDIPVADELNRCRYVVDRCHPGLTDLFVKKFREEAGRKPSILAKLNEPAPKTTQPKKAKSKGMEL